MQSTQPERMLSLFDPALDLHAMDGKDELQDFMRTRSPEAAKLHPDMRPMIFHVGDIDPATFVSHVETAPTEIEKFVRAFRYGVRRVDDFVGRDGKGPMPLTPAEKTTGAGGMTIESLSDEQVRQFAPAYLRDIGERVFYRSFFDPRSAATWRPRPSSAAAFLVLLSSQAAARTESDPASEE